MNRTTTLTPLAAKLALAARLVAATAGPPRELGSVSRPSGIPPGGSALTESVQASPASAPLLGWGPTVVVVSGLAFLLVRPALWAVPGGTAALAGGYLVLLAAGAAVAGRARPGPVAWPAVLALGVAAVAGAAVVGGSAPPLRADAVAVAMSVLAAGAEEALFRGALWVALAPGRWIVPAATHAAANLLAVIAR